MSTSLLISVLLLSPLVGFLINGLFVKQNNKNYKLAGFIATLASTVSFVCAALLYCQLLKLEPQARKIHEVFFNWINVADFKANMGFMVDPINAIMIMIITGVGSLIHLYSVGYMSHDAKPAKFFAYLNLFLFNMLILVLGDNLLVMFVGWEGVGLCSYLLIGFWFQDPEKAAAGMKAFITNRIGDAGFLLGLFLIFTTFGTIDFQELAKITYQTDMGWGALTLATLFLFVGATGKSAQIPLYVWLPDAMAGPTPVSALIHAATMVTAGIYMIVRLNFMFVAAPNTMMIIACVGAATALFAATIGLFQYDIKKILAYSTVSQLGFMFLAVGVGAFGAGLFHLMTHAFFKALMFLGAGSVIHGMHEEQDVRKMGGLAKKMPITYITFLVGWLAIIGTPLFSGFFSKDEILWKAYSSPLGSKALWVVGVLAAMCTAFYMTRLMALTFWGKSRVNASVHVHESPLVMTIPLIILAILSLVGGWVGIPAVIGEHFHIPNILEHWLHPVIAEVSGHGSHLEEWLTMGASVCLAALSAGTAYYLYVKRPELTAVKPNLKAVHNIIHNKYFVDEAYFATIIKPLVQLSRGLWAFVDVKIVDRTTYLITDFVKGTGNGLRLMTNGNVQQYALYIIFGIVVSLAFVFMR
ncbi:MAG: NADH-quinone oxidoreductase subunit L [Oligoflexia bacterium]|nr:NADH-quinone oxidoreductase subunit L [Oligoflexia bacterium]